MLGTTRRLAAVAAAAVLAAALPATAGEVDAAAMACQMKPLVRVADYQQSVLLYGAYVAPQGAPDAQLACGLVRDGVTYYKQGEKIPGPVAAVAANPTVAMGPWATCYEIRVTHLSGLSDTYDTCP